MNLHIQENIYPSPDWSPLNSTTMQQEVPDISGIDQDPLPTVDATRPLLSSHLVRWILGLILLIALGLRLYGIDWDDGGLFHPDERAILMQTERLDIPSSGQYKDLLSAEESPLNPGWFNYGSLPLYTLRAVQAVASPVSDWDVFDLRIPGRTISAIADTVTILLMFVFASRWYGARVGLLAAALGSIAVLHIQLSHFFAVDTILTMFILATLVASTRVAYKGAKRDIVVAGMLLGLSVATKASAAPLVLAIVTSHVIYAFSISGERFSLASFDQQKVRTFFFGGLISAVSAFFTLLIVQPYMFIDFGQFWTDFSRESEMVRGVVDFPYTRQYENTPRFLYQASQLGLWGLGPVLGITVWAALGTALVTAWRSRRKVDMVVLAWVLPYLAITAWFDVKFLRYMLPVTPLLLIYASRTTWWLSNRLRTFGEYRNIRVLSRIAAPLVIGGLLFFTGHYTLAFESIYAKPHPAHNASDWIAENVPPGSLILKEHWDEGLPELHQYESEELPLYDHDSLVKLNKISDSLAHADYLVIFSNRLYGTIPRMPDRYPITSVYYEKLFLGELGYELVYTDDRHSSFLGFGYQSDRFARVDLSHPKGFEEPRGLNLSLGWADESFTVYDQNRPMVFKNTGELSSDDIQGIIEEDVTPSFKKSGLMLTRDQHEVQVSGGTFSDIVTFGSEDARWSWLLWLAVIQGFGLLVLPIGYVFFRPLPNRGYLLHKPLGLLLVAFVTWIMASTGIIGFGRSSIVLSILVWTAASAIVGWPLRTEISNYIRSRWRMLFGMEALFLLAFIAFLLVRVANPDLWHPWRGGEKPMDFAYLNAVTRSTLMPPYDPWFAGGYLNYYYFGQFLVATMIRLTGIAPSVAYNLAVPMFFAMTIGGAFTVVHGMVERVQLRSSAVQKGAVSAVVAGLTGALFVTVIGNLDGLLQVVQGANRVLLEGESFGEFDFWRSSRMYDANSGGNEITEFPFFSFLFADLHAHMIAIPFVLLTIGLAIATFLRSTSSPRGTPAVTIGGLVILGLSIGATRIINGWDFPTSMTLVAIALVAGELLSKQGSLQSRFGRGIGRSLLVGGLSVLLFMPFHQHYEIEAGIHQNEILSPLWRYLSIYGIFLLGITVYLAIEIRRTVISGNLMKIAPPSLRSIPLLIMGIVVLIVGLIVAIISTGQATLTFTLLLILMLLAVWVLALRRRTTDRLELGIATAITSLALGLGAFAELFSVDHDIVRQNTVFKLYLQAWVLFGIASAYLLWRTWAFSELEFPLNGFLTLKRVKTVGVTGFALLIAVGLIYPVLATPVRVNDQFDPDVSGLSGTAYMANATYFQEKGPLVLTHDLEAIEWLQENVDGSPTIIEGLSDLYQWGNRVSVYTGLPTVIGWDWHQRQQRPEFAAEVTRRRFEIDNFYNTRNLSEAEELLRKYDVKLVYVGEMERTHYPEYGISKFDRMGDYGLSPVYNDGPVIIYEYQDPQIRAIVRQ